MPRLIASILVLSMICFSTGCGQSKNTATASLRLIPAQGDIGPDGEFSSLDAFYQTHVDLMCSDAVLLTASKSLLRSKTRTTNPILKNDYRSLAADWKPRLWVTRNKDSQVLNIYFEGSTPEASEESLNIILDAFTEQIFERDYRNLQHQIEVLEKALADHRTQWRKLSEQAQESNDSMAEKLASMHEQLFFETQRQLAGMQLQSAFRHPRINILSDVYCPAAHVEP